MESRRKDALSEAQSAFEQQLIAAKQIQGVLSPNSDPSLPHVLQHVHNPAMHVRYPRGSSGSELRDLGRMGGSAGGMDAELSMHGRSNQQAGRMLHAGLLGAEQAIAALGGTRRPTGSAACEVQDRASAFAGATNGGGGSRLFPAKRQRMVPDAATSRMEQLQREVSAAAKIADRHDLNVDGGSNSSSSSRKYLPTGKESQVEARIGAALQDASADANLRLAQERAFWSRVQEGARAGGISALPSQCVLSAGGSMSDHQQALSGAGSGQQAAGSFPATCMQQHLLRAASASARPRQAGDGGAMGGAMTLNDILGSAACRRYSHLYPTQRQAEDAADASLAALQAEAMMCSAFVAAAGWCNNAMSGDCNVDGLAPSMERHLMGCAGAPAPASELGLRGGAASPRDAFARAGTDRMVEEVDESAPSCADAGDVPSELRRLPEEDLLAAEPSSRAESPSNDWWLQPGSEPGQTLLDASGNELDDWFYQHMHEGGFGSLV